MELFVIFVGAVLVNNLVLARFLGICPFFGVSKKVETAIGMSLAVTFVMAVAGRHYMDSAVQLCWISSACNICKLSFLSLLSPPSCSLWRW